MHIERGAHGGRTVVSERNGARIVTRGHGGYVQRAYLNRGGHAYYSRTFYAGGRYHVGLYRGYGWGGHTYFGYYPGVWYHPGFYGWGWHPWGAPVFWGVGAWGVPFWARAAGIQAALATARTERHVVIRSCIQFLSSGLGRLQISDRDTFAYT